MMMCGIPRAELPRAPESEAVSVTAHEPLFVSDTAETPPLVSIS